MARHDNALQGVMLVALLILFPMTIQLLVHQDESPLWRTVYVEVDGEDAEDAFTEIRNMLYTFFLEKDKYKTSAGIERKRTQKQAREKVLQETVRNAPTKLKWNK